MQSTGSWYAVRTTEGEMVQCRLRGQFRIKGIKTTNPVVVGDHVGFIIEEDGCGYITELKPRKNYIDRKSTNLSKISHIIAANLDHAFLVVTMRDPRTSLGFIHPPRMAIWYFCAMVAMSARTRALVSKRTR